MLKDAIAGKFDWQATSCAEDKAPLKLNQNESMMSFSIRESHGLLASKAW